MNKKGISHIEMIISFVIFLGIVVVIFIFLRPIREPTLSNVVLDIVERGMQGEASSTLATIPFKIDETIFANITFLCFRVAHPLDIDDADPDKLHTSNILLKKSTNNPLAFDIESDYLEIAEEDPFYSLSFSFTEIFPQEALGRDYCPLVPEDKVVFSAPRTETLYSFSKLSQISVDYAENYNALKGRWFVPSKNDFAIKVLDAGGNVLFDMPRNVPPRRDVFAREIEGQMLRGTDVERITINVRVW